MEHIFTLSAIVQNAIHHGLPMALTYLNLKNAFGSVSHRHISEMIAHIKLLQEIRSYINSAYSKLSAYIATKSWSTARFPISKGVF